MNRRQFVYSLACAAATAWGASCGMLPRKPEVAERAELIEWYTHSVAVHPASAERLAAMTERLAKDVAAFNSSSAGVVAALNGFEASPRPAPPRTAPAPQR